MFLKNSFSPAYATAGADSARRERTDDTLTYDAGSAEGDARNFAGGPTQPRRPDPTRQAPQRPPMQRRNKPSSSSIIIAIAAVAAIVLLIVLIAVFASGSGKNIEYENGAYLAFCDDDDSYYVASNGEVLKKYDGEITLIPSDDNRFAYIIETTDEGYALHVVEGKKINTITPSPVDKILATASLEVGAVWLELDNGVYFYNEKRGEERISKDYDTLLEDPSKSGSYNYMFCISADASTVAYAKTNVEKGDFSLCLYSDGNPTSSVKHMRPVALSDDGSLVYCYGISSKDYVTKLLYVVSTKDSADREQIDEGFESIVDINTEGNEVIYTTRTESGLSTHIYAFNEKKLGKNENEPSMIGKGTYVPVNVNGVTARYGTFARTYFRRSDYVADSSPATYYLDKKYERHIVAKFDGKFDPSGDYFYYTTDENILWWIDLNDKQYTYAPNKVSTDVIEFEVTQKGNVYWLSDIDRDLKFYDRAEDRTTTIHYSVEEISMQMYTNTLYFALEDDVTVYKTKEGSEKDEVKFASDPIVSVPVFANDTLKKGFAAVYDEDHKEWRIFYTSTGKSFKYVTTAADIQDVTVLPDYNGSTGGNGGSDSSSDLPG